MLKPGKWPVVARDAALCFIWGECQGSGSTPYRVCADLRDMACKCTCPSRKFPCKHGLALLWRYVETKDAFVETERPVWVDEWANRRRRPKADAEGDEPEKKRPKKDIRRAGAAPQEAAADPAKAERARKAAAKRAAAREASVAAGLDELEQWIADEVAEGFGTFSHRTDRCRIVAARLVDARAPTLARAVDDLPAQVFRANDADRGRVAMEALGRVSLLAQAYRRQGALPPALREDVRRRIGWSISKEQLLDAPDTLRIDDAWTVLGVSSQAQSDGLIRHETWLRRHGDGTPRWSLLLDYAPAAGNQRPTYRAGEVLVATLAFYPSAWPLRGVVVHRAPPADADLPDDAGGFGGVVDGLRPSLEEVRAVMAVHPWLDPVPWSAAGVRLGRLRAQAYVTDGHHMMPVHNGGDWIVTASAAGPLTALGLATMGGVRLLAAATAWGTVYAP